MARQAFRRISALRSSAQEARHPFADVPVKRHTRGWLVLQNSHVEIHSDK